MSERSTTWGAAPNRWAPTPAAPARGWGGEGPVAPDRAEPTDGRHAFDRDAALTPIFTALRRSGQRRPRTSAPPLRSVPPPVAYRDDPPTAPIPVVPALYAVEPHPSGGYPSVDPYATGGYPVATPHGPSGYPVAEPHTTGGYPAIPHAPGHRYTADAYPPSPNEMTAVWSPSADPAAWSPVTDTGRHHRRLAPAGW